MTHTLDDLSQEEAKEFYQWRIDHRWFDRSRGKWNFTFHHGTYISYKAYEKSYRKTTEELIQLFLQQKSSHNKNS